MSTNDLVEFLRARLDEDEQWALAASKPYPHAEGNPQIPAEGLHWQWGVGPNWDPVEIDPATQEFVDDGGETSVLISVETWRSDRWEMPRRYGTVEEMDAAAGGHIVRHDPARVLRDVEAKRRILDGHKAGRYGGCVTCHPDSCGCVGGGSYPCDTVRLLALPYTEHPEYREEWCP